MKVTISLCAVFSVLMLASCGSFGEGMLAGLAGVSYGMPQSGGSMGYNTVATSGSMDYLLDPNYAIAQQSQYNSIATQSVNNTSSSRALSSYDYSSSTGSSRKKCMKISASDNAHCNGTGVCSRCNGKGRYYDTSFGNASWRHCSSCGGTGKCPSCNGSGYK